MADSERARVKSLNGIAEETSDVYRSKRRLEYGERLGDSLHDLIITERSYAEKKARNGLFSLEEVQDLRLRRDNFAIALARISVSDAPDNVMRAELARMDYARAMGQIPQKRSRP